MKHRTTKRRKAKRAFPTSIVAIAFLAIVMLSVGWGTLYPDRGSGGTDWRIGSPLTNLGNAYFSRSLPEATVFALKLVNRDRQINGLSPLVEDPLLSEAAQRHALDMLNRSYYSHITPEGKTPTDRFARIGGRGGVGENLMWQEKSFGATLNYSLLEAFQKSWMYSDGHRENLLTPDYTRFGYGIALNPISGQIYAVQQFASPEPRAKEQVKNTQTVSRS